MDLEDPEEPAPQKPEPSAQKYEKFEDLPEDVQAAFIAVVDRREELHRFFDWRAALSRHDAEEETCEVYQTLLTKLMDGTTVDNQRAYAFGIAKNRVLQIWKRRKAKIQQFLADNMELFDDRVTVLRWEGFNDSLHFKELFEQCTQTLSPYQSMVLYLREIRDLPYKAISELLDDQDVSALRNCRNQALKKIHADVIALADLRLAARFSSYNEMDTRKKPKKPPVKRTKPQE
ncbi:sigma-70 family RNA polymerase sigma factor [Streptomyces sp. NPDC006872]|uniref:RNA polymerase sigma factor n=1 Tax=Streptomyces sp. NPDC006872 TaxID=3155720 RepID=UPI003405417C